MYLALCALIPLVGGIVAAFIQFGSDRVRNIFIEAVTALTSLCVFIAISVGSEARLTLFEISGSFVCAFRADGLSKVFIGLSALLWPFAVLYSFGYMKHEERTGLFYSFYTLAYAAVILLAASENLFTLYIFYELLTVVTLPLVEHEHSKEAYRAGRAYLQYLSAGAALGFAAMIITSCLSGGAAFTKGGVLPAGVSTVTAGVCLLMIFFGFGAKAAVFPLCRWLPKAGVAPTPVTALLHAVAVVNAGVFSVCRGIYYVLGTEALAGSGWQRAILLFSAFTVVYGSAMALRQTHLKRRLAWSTVSNLSYMLCALSLMTENGMTAGLAHMVFHGFMKIVLFFAAGAVLVVAGRTDTRETRGLAKRMPVTFGCFTFAGLALTGVPPLMGFTSKYLIITETMRSGGFIAGVALIISAMLTCVYIMGVALPAYFAPENLDNSEIKDADITMKVSMLAICGIILVVSLFANQAVQLIGGI